MKELPLVSDALLFVLRWAEGEPVHYFGGLHLLPSFALLEVPGCFGHCCMLLYGLSPS